MIMKAQLVPSRVQASFAASVTGKAMRKVSDMLVSAMTDTEFQMYRDTSKNFDPRSTVDELVVRARDVVDAVWKGVIREALQGRSHGLTNSQSGLGRYIELTIAILREQTAIHRADWISVMQYMTMFVALLPRAVAHTLERCSQIWMPSRLYLSVSLLMLMAKSKPGYRPGFTIRSAKPLAIPLTVQPCAP